jgi:uncharacterized repeat protein (TIGR01451 family)
MIYCASYLPIEGSFIKGSITKHMKKQLAVLLSMLGLLYTFGTQKVSADCDYGQSCPPPANLTVNKYVKNPITNVFVENLGSTDPTFSPGSTVTFKLSIKNGSGETFSPVEVIDQFPDYMTYVSSSVQGSYDAGKRRLVIKLENLIAGESRNIEVTAKVADRSAFASDRDFFCVSNFTSVTAPARPDGDNDTAEFCITTRVGGATNLPVAGFNDFITLIPFVSLGGIGLVLLKKTK